VKIQRACKNDTSFLSCVHPIKSAYEQTIEIVSKK
jgi:hypothetical protein